MNKNESLSKKAFIKPLIVGQIVSILSMLIILVVAAVAVTNLNLSDDWILILALISMSMGSFFGGIIVSKLLQKNGLVFGLLNGLIFFLITTFISFAVNDGAITIITLLKLILFVICSGIGGIVGVNIKSRQKVL